MKRLLVFLLLFIFGFIIDFKVFNVPNRNSLIKVEIKGEVEKEGIYELENYATLRDLLTLSKLKEDADISSLNLNSILHDGDLIIIPQINNEINKISINTSDKESLIKIPGIGSSTADKIIAYREEYGYFQSLEDIKNVKGIGDTKYEKIKEYIKL